MGKRAIQQSTGTIVTAISDAFAGMGILKAELRGWYSSLPKQLKTSPTAERLAIAIEIIERQKEPALTERAKELLSGVEICYNISFKKRQTRAERRDRYVAMLREVMRVIDSQHDEIGDWDDVADTGIVELRCAILRAIMGFESIEFPGMFNS